ncbi:hypothetical protein Lalb_Chr03g0041821 [Lupinus albus]|uniref:Uncharacterized protein n=1 Tax=Lupinus albus TaxID=3870 RepID=A0A6A4QW04_LUPAL|nr:hypothetical protein Lalb_Chr03g0041821 [Lupinus albus]
MTGTLITLDGNLRVYSLNNVSNKWYISWQAIPDSCEIHGICGANSTSVHAVMILKMERNVHVFKVTK